MFRESASFIWKKRFEIVIFCPTSLCCVCSVRLLLIGNNLACDVHLNETLHRTHYLYGSRVLPYHIVRSVRLVVSDMKIFAYLSILVGLKNETSFTHFRLLWCTGILCTNRIPVLGLPSDVQYNELRTRHGSNVQIINVV